MQSKEIPRYDDYPLSPVPNSGRLSWFSIAVMRFGQFATLAELLMGATLGYGMGIIPAFSALALGTAILLAIAIPMGIIGQRTGLATSLLTRWWGLGRWGSGIFSIMTGLSVMGWFGIQNALFAQGIQHLAGFGPFWAWTLLSGVVVTVLVYGGILTMGWVAYIAVPLFLLLLGIGALHAMLSPVAHIQWFAPPVGHPPIPLATAVTIVVGSFITGAILSPDMTRFHLNATDVIKQTVSTYILGNALIAGLGIISAQLLNTSNLTTALALAGTAGLVLFVTSTIKVSDWDIYGAALALVNGLDIIGVPHLSRRTMSIVVGFGGTALAMLGIINHFEPFLLVIGVATPPVAAIVLIEYFWGKSQDVDASRVDSLPSAPLANWGALAAWGVGFVVGQWVTWGIGAVNSLVAAAVIYGLWIKGRQRVHRPPHTVLS